MRNWPLSLVVLAALTSSGIAQDLGRKNDAQALALAARLSKKATNLVGTVSDDGHFLIAEPDQNVWTVINPDATKAYAGQRISIVVQTSSDNAELRVLSVIPGKAQ